ncbi:MAG: hypothetical protein NC833_03155, partial [Candidatus Omnitrophica bacterium]|nr:hypothetical protein [Candidatus Omnitrophota bacterium]
YENSQVYENACVYGKARLYGNACVYGDAQVYENAQVFDDAQVYGNAQVFGDAWVYRNAQVGGDEIKSYQQIKTITFSKHTITLSPNFIFVGCLKWKISELDKIKYDEVKEYITESQFFQLKKIVKLLAKI